MATANCLFERRFPALAGGPGMPQPPLLALGMLQWGTTNVIASQKVLLEPEARAIYDAFRSRGVVLFDTAEGYGGGSSEKRLGRLTQREAGTKSKAKAKGGADDGATAETDASQENTAVLSGSNLIIMTKFLPVPWRWTHSSFERALRASNARMGIQTCPIYLLHSPMHLGRGIEYWVKSAAICKRKGLLRYYGLSNCSAEEVRRAVAAGEKFGVEVVVNQVHYSLLDFNSESLQKMQRTCEELNVSIIAYNTLGQGLLTDNLTEEKFKGNIPAKMMHIGYKDLLPLRTTMRKIADNHSDSDTAKGTKVSMAQVALSWARAKGVIPLVGCRSTKQAEDTLGSLSLDLSSEEVATLDALALTRCTLDSPRWRRKLFVVLAGVVMTACRWLDFFGVGSERIKA
ncbi:hypothetical protein ACHAXT_010989 [Thalassiosira profunda]